MDMQLSFKDHDHVVVFPTPMVHALKGQSCRHGSIANDRNVLAVVPFDFVGHRHPQGRTDAGGTVPYSKSVIRAFTPLWKTTEAFVDPVGMESVPARPSKFCAHRLGVRRPKRFDLQVY